MITKNKINFTLLILMLLGTVANSQTFKKGQITTQDGQTINGYIKDNSFQKLSEKIIFKTDKKANNSTTFTPETIQGFAFADGDTFQSFDIAYATTANGNQIEGKRFLHLIHAGAVSLYELRNNDESPLFIKKDDASLQVLGWGTENEPLYIDILTSLLADNAKVEIAHDLPLEPAAIVEVLDQYEGNTPQSLRAGTYQPTVIAWATAAMPYSRDGFSGFAKGGMIESGMPLSNGSTISGLLGLEFYEGERSIEGKEDEIAMERKWNYSFLLRGQYALRTNRLIAPYVAFGTVVEVSANNNFRLHTALGVNLNLGRHLVKVELADPTTPFLRVGYGFSLVK